MIELALTESETAQLSYLRQVLPNSLVDEYLQEKNEIQQAKKRRKTEELEEVRATKECRIDQVMRRSDGDAYHHPLGVHMSQRPLYPYVNPIDQAVSDSLDDSHSRNDRE